LEGWTRTFFAIVKNSEFAMNLSGGLSEPLYLYWI
jgi:hypothetical protein